MKIGLDLDETISALPEWFALISRALVEAGHEVHVITYRPVGSEAAVHAELQDHGIGYTALHVPLESVQAPAWKAGLAAELGLDLMVEDSPEVLARMPEGTARLWLCDPEIFDLDVCIQAMSRAPAPR